MTNLKYLNIGINEISQQFIQENALSSSTKLLRNWRMNYYHEDQLDFQE